MARDPTSASPSISPELGLLGVATLCVLVFSALGSLAPIGSVSGVVLAIFQSGLPALGYVLGAWGLGYCLRPLFSRSPEAAAIQLGIGLAIMLSLSHGLGVLGLLNAVTAIGSVTLGLALGAVQIFRSPAIRQKQVRLSWGAVWFAPPAALLLVAAASPPGWLWASEFGGYDALSYHLQLPQEWIASGAIEPLAHNVYSYLPSYVESAFTHVAVMTLAPGEIQAGDLHMGLLADSGWRALGPHFLHAMLALSAAWLIRALAFAFLRNFADDSDRDLLERFSWQIGALVLCTPWVIVVGSLAYNEMGVVALGATAMIVLLSPEIRPGARGLLVGLLVGVACGAKPTALFLVGGPVGVLMLAIGLWGLVPSESRAGEEKQVAKMRPLLTTICVGCLAGLLALAPWLVRNARHAENPVFPQLTSVLGEAHWTSDQAARYAGGHRVDASIIERVRMAVLPVDGAFRGLSHPQWLIFWLIAILGSVVAFRQAASRRASMILLGALAVGLIFWLSVTHIQSRFLIPLIPVAVLSSSLGLWMLNENKRVGSGFAIGALAIQLLASAVLFFSQHEGAANYLTGVGPSFSLGEVARSQLPDASPRERADFLRGLEENGQVPPTAWINLSLEPGELIYMLADATPFYVRPPVLYHTTWDTSPLGELMRASPENPAAWTQGLRDLGVRYVDVSFSELARLSSDGWYDPDVNPATIDPWIRSLGEPVRAWPQIGRVVFDLQRADTP